MASKSLTGRLPLDERRGVIPLLSRQEMNAMSLEERFWYYVQKSGPDECWQWLGRIHPGGHPLLVYKRKHWNAQRLAIVLHDGEIAHNRLVVSSCDNKLCCNPAHLISYANVEDRFWRWVDIKGENDCWEWKGWKNHVGYGGFDVWDESKKETVFWFSHRFSWYLKHGSIDPDLECRHGCDNRACCNPTHLSMGTHKDNMGDMVARNRQSKGSDKWKAVLTEAQVLEIKSLAGTMSISQIAKKFGVSNSAIAPILAGVNWKHIGENVKGVRFADCSAKLNDQKALEIRAQKGLKSVAKLAEEYGVTKSSIYDVLNYKNYRHIP